MKQFLLILLVFLILLFPIRSQMKDGGTVVYNALLYRVDKVHRIKTIENNYVQEYSEGIIVKILGIEIFNNVE